MVKIGKLEVKTPRPDSRIRVVRLPGHELDIEHFFPSNWEILRVMRRSVFVRSNLGQRPRFVKKDVSRNISSIRLTPTSEAKLALHIRRLRLPRINAEAPLAVL
jgi:hypothetical protein